MPEVAGFGRQLFASMFSDDPAPEVNAAVVVAHPGDESVGASWLLTRMQPRASVYCLTGAPQACANGFSALSGAPVQILRATAFADATFAADVEDSVWLMAAATAVSKPRVLVTHMCEGENLDHDITAFAVHMTAKLLTSGGAPPLVIEFPSRQNGPEDAQGDSPRARAAEQAVRIEFGPESRQVKRRMLRRQGDEHALDRDVLRSESYLLTRAGNPAELLDESAQTYDDAPWCTVTRFRALTRSIATSLARASLVSSSRV
jgi:hypothetical protein